MTTEPTCEELRPLTQDIIQAIKQCPFPNHPNLDVVVSMLNTGPGSPNRTTVESALQCLIEDGILCDKGYKGYQLVGDGLSNG